MSTLSQPVRAAATGFLAMAVLAMAFAAMRGSGVLEHHLASRALGLVLSAMTVLVGNLLPKARALRSAAAERATGTVLVLAGFGSLLLFMFASLPTARHGSALLGVGALAVIAVTWGRVALSGRPLPPAWSAERRRMVALLLLALGYLLGTAGVVFGLDDRHAVRAITPWLSLGFFFAYAVVSAVLGEGPRARSHD